MLGRELVVVLPIDCRSGCMLCLNGMFVRTNKKSDDV
jgi:hypothetical protein